MRLHQVLTGSCNDKSSHASLGTLNEFNFIAYASGCDVIILNETFMRVQVIPGNKLGNLIVLAVSCSKGNGKIAVANSNGIYIYSPQLSANGSLHSSLSNVSWSLNSHITIQNDSRVACLSWSYEPFLSNRRSGLLSAFNDGSLVVWRPCDDDLGQLDDSLSPSTKFHVGSSSTNSECASIDANSLKDCTNNSCLLEPPLAEGWKSLVIGHVPGVPKLVEFSSDGRYFATLSESSRRSTGDLVPDGVRTSTVLVWFRDLPSFSCGKDPSGLEQEEKWEHVVLSHPVRVISFSWRLCSRYLPPGWMPNVLVTSSEDHVCRLWVEVTNHGSDSLGFPTSKDRYSKSWTYGHTESTATITLPVSHNHVSSTVLTTSETQTSGPVDSCLPTRFTYPLPPTLLHHPVLHQLLELWLVDPFSDAQVSIEFARSNAVNGNDRLALYRRSYPRFALATSLALENPSNPNAELSGR
ncbi:hypothetical protein P879_11224 [Paragonimus westermani]|uniref:Uncharacterized protein n=1 Tax=Paragonimus westermani TaxID=34504 RepID=A0A8T0D667_9TREM|nr:hypothetical protein P879_11224 [Paragonimus westermani]